LSLRIGKLGGTTIDVDPSFLILCAFFVLNELNQHDTQAAVLTVPVLFVSLIVHELAHAGMIGLFGYGPSRIVLAGMGGVTINERRAKAWQELLISVAGPLSSFAIAGAAWLSGRHNTFLQLLFFWNLVWGVFNLLPIPPLDGGNAMRQFVRLFLNEASAFHVATWIGIVVGILCAIFAFMGRQIFIAILMGYFVVMNFRQWMVVREMQARARDVSPPPPR
jgi:Zn-dependent protease